MLSIDMGIVDIVDLSIHHRSSRLGICSMGLLCQGFGSVWLISKLGMRLWKCRYHSCTDKHGTP